MPNEDHDMLIEIRSDLKHVRERVDKVSEQVGKQWDRLDSQGRQVEGHHESLYWLKWGFRGAIGGLAGLAYAWFKGDK